MSSFLFILISIGIGLLISIVTDSQVVAIVLTAIATIIPGYLYSGISSPIDSMEGIAYVFAHAYPIMYYVKIMYDCFLVGDGFTSSTNLLYMLILFVFLVVIYSASIILIRKKIV